MERDCIAAATLPPYEVRGHIFNHHPERKRGVNATDRSPAARAAAEIEAQVSGVIPRPISCGRSYQRHLWFKLTYRTNRDAGWRSMDRWQRLNLFRFPSSPSGGQSRFLSFYVAGEVDAIDNGCVEAGRLHLRYEVVRRRDDTPIAKSSVLYDIPADTWFQDRCQGRFTIKEQGRARRCSRPVNGADPGGSPTRWAVRTKWTSCRTAYKIGQDALETSLYSQEWLTRIKVDGWRCSFGHVGTAACRKRAKRIFLIFRGSAGTRCRDRSEAIDRVVAAGSSCSEALKLAAAAEDGEGSDGRAEYTIDGKMWPCSIYTYLVPGDFEANNYHCFNNGDMVGFEIVSLSGVRGERLSNPEFPGQGKEAFGQHES